jgi:hypothetical protein
MSSKTIKKLLLSLIVVGALASFTVGGTFAVLKGETSNSNDSLASGSLTMDNSVGSGAACHSQSGALNVNTGCTTLFSSGLMYPIPSAAEPPLPASTTYTSTIVTIKNTGTLPATLSTYLAACASSTTTGAPSFSWSAINPCCPGGAFPCTDGLKGSLDFFVQECSAVTLPSTCTSPLAACQWPVSTTTACTFVDDSLGDFNSFHHDNTHYLSLGPIAAGATRYFQIAAAEPSDAVNGLQGQTATLSLYWHEQ